MSVCVVLVSLAVTLVGGQNNSLGQTETGRQGVSKKSADDVSMTVKDPHGRGGNSSFQQRHSRSTEVNGGWSDFSPWTTLSVCSRWCNGQAMEFSRTRYCNQPAPTVGGRPCPGDTQETKIKACNHCPLNGGWAEFGSWSLLKLCSVTCGRGTEFIVRNRRCTKPKPANKGRQCKGMVSETSQRLCILPPCENDLQGRCVCEDDWEAHSKYCYKVGHNIGSWQDGAETCSEMGAHLAEITSHKQSVFVKRYLQKKKVTEHVWIGGTDPGGTRDWRWMSSGIRISYTNWAQGEPSMKAKCISLGYLQKFRWDNMFCKTRNKYLCQKTICE